MKVINQFSDLIVSTDPTLGERKNITRIWEPTRDHTSQTTTTKKKSKHTNG